MNKLKTLVPVVDLTGTVATTIATTTKIVELINSQPVNLATINATFKGMLIHETIENNLDWLRYEYGVFFYHFTFYESGNLCRIIDESLDTIIHRPDLELTIDAFVLMCSEKNIYFQYSDSNRFPESLQDAIQELMKETTFVKPYDKNLF